MLLFRGVVLAVMLLSDGDKQDVNVPITAEEADAGLRSNRTEDLCITSERCDFDRSEGVALFEGAVHVRYSDNCELRSDQIYVFTHGSNELSRIVAIGNVSITNELKSGTCAMAEFLKRRKEIRMYGNALTDAVLVDAAEGESLAGREIRFWLDSEQVQVKRSRIRVDRSEGNREGIPL